MTRVILNYRLKQEKRHPHTCNKNWKENYRLKQEKWEKQRESLWFFFRKRELTLKCLSKLLQHRKTKLLLFRNILSKYSLEQCGIWSKQPKKQKILTNIHEKNQRKSSDFAKKKKDKSPILTFKQRCETFLISY